MQEQVLIEKIRRLPPEKQAEVEHFVDFLNVPGGDSRLIQSALRLSEEAFLQAWNNDADSASDQP